MVSSSLPQWFLLQGVAVRFKFADIWKMLKIVPGTTQLLNYQALVKVITLSLRSKVGTFQPNYKDLE